MTEFLEKWLWRMLDFVTSPGRKPRLTPRICGDSMCPYCIYMGFRYNKAMIRSFADKETEKIFNQQFSKRIPADISKVALRKLMMIDAAMSISDLKAPPANRLEMLQGDRVGQWSIRINDKWRIVFTPVSGGSDYEGVEIVDYH